MRCGLICCSNYMLIRVSEMAGLSGFSHELHLEGPGLRSTSHESMMHKK